MAGSWLFVLEDKITGGFAMELVHHAQALQHPRLADLRTTQEAAIDLRRQRLLVAKAVDISKTKPILDKLAELEKYWEDLSK